MLFIPLFTRCSLLQWNIPQWRHINAQFFSEVARVRSRTLRIVQRYRLGLSYTVWISATYLIFFDTLFTLLREPKGFYSQVHDVWCPVVLWHTNTQQIGGSICLSVSGGHLSLSLRIWHRESQLVFSESLVFFFLFALIMFKCGCRGCSCLFPYSYSCLISLFSCSGISAVYMAFLELLKPPPPPRKTPITHNSLTGF